MQSNNELSDYRPNKNPPKRNREHKIALGSMVVLFVFGIVATIITNSSKLEVIDRAISTVFTPISATVSPTKPRGYDLFEISQIFDAYENNKLSAAAKFEGKTFAVNGYVNSVDSSITGEPYITITDGSNMLFSSSIHCEFPESARNALLLLNKGDKVTVKGTGDGIMITSFFIKNCEFIQ